MTLKEEMGARRKNIISREKVKEGVKKLLFEVQDQFPYNLSFSFNVYCEGDNIIMCYHNVKEECIITTVDMSLADFKKMLTEELGFFHDLDYDSYVLWIDG